MTAISTEQHRKECEARHVLTFPKEQRTAYYLAVEGIRGKKALTELIAEVKRQYQLREKEAGHSL